MRLKRPLLYQGRDSLYVDELSVFTTLALVTIVPIEPILELVIMAPIITIVRDRFWWTGLSWAAKIRELEIYFWAANLGDILHYYLWAAGRLRESQIYVRAADIGEIDDYWRTGYHGRTGLRLRLHGRTIIGHCS